MKITVDLSSVLNSDGSVVDSVKQEILDEAKERVFEYVVESSLREFKDSIVLEARKAVADHVQSILPGILDEKYTPVDPYGSKSEETTMRLMISKTIQEQMVYSRGDSYNRNEFTNAVNEAMGKKLYEFKSGYNKIVDAEFTQNALDYATTRLKERLGIK